MHEHGGGHAGHGGGLNLLPLWMQLIWVLAMAGVVAAHSVHVGTASGLAARQIRVWHGTHLLMGVGMLWMFAPWQGGMPGPMRAWQWAISMGYMFLAMDAGARGFFDQAFGQPFGLGLNGEVGLTEQTLWASCLVALVILACIPRRARA